MSEKRLIIVVKKLALQKKVKSFSEHTSSYNENSSTGFNSNQSNQLLGTALNEMVNLTTGVVAFNNGVLG